MLRWHSNESKSRRADAPQAPKSDQDLIKDGRLKSGDLESRVTSAMRDLPTDLALDAIERYQQANLETIRSKTGFMMGARNTSKNTSWTALCEHLA